MPDTNDAEDMTTVNDAKADEAAILTAGDRVARISGTDTLTLTLPSGFMPGPTHEISAINAQGVVSGERAGRQPRRMHSGLAN
jgi:hypothetical protein